MTFLLVRRSANSLVQDSWFRTLVAGLFAASFWRKKFLSRTTSRRCKHEGGRRPRIRPVTEAEEFRIALGAEPGWLLNARE
jgi:hypothetical protein